MRSIRNRAEYKRCLLLIAPFRYSYPSWGSIHIFTVGVAQFLAAIPFFLHHLEPLRQEDRIQGSAYPEGFGYPAYHFSPAVLFEIGGMAGPLDDMLGDNEHRQPLEGEDDHEQPGIPDTYFKSRYKRHFSTYPSLFASSCIWTEGSTCINECQQHQASRDC